ncbi:MAG TPA: TIGR03086 family metal-binding protein [Streptosporangiaceae bacterium]
MTDPDVLADFDQALAATDRIVSGIKPGQWSVPTPCRGLDVRAVLGHLVTGHLVFIARVQGLPVPDRAADHLGDDPAAAFRRSGQALRQAFGQPGVLRETYQGPLGAAPGVFLVQVRIVELLGHGWDLAKATGQPADYPPDLVERALAQARKGLADRPDGPGAPFAPEVPVPASAPVMDRLAGFLGRQP